MHLHRYIIENIEQGTIVSVVLCPIYDICSKEFSKAVDIVCLKRQCHLIKFALYIMSHIVNNIIVVWKKRNQIILYMITKLFFDTIIF